MLCSSPAYTQNLHRVFGGNTRALLNPGMSAGLDRERLAYHPLQLLTVSGPALHSVTSYDDVYRERADSTRHTVSRLANVSRLELPWSKGRDGGVAVEVAYLSTDLQSSPVPGQTYAFNQRLARLNTGLAWQAWAARLSVGASLGASRLSASWVPGYALEVAVRPHRWLHLLLSGARQPEVRKLRLKNDAETVALEVKNRRDKWGGSLTLGLGSRIELQGEYHRHHVYSRSAWYETDGYRLNPQLRAVEAKLALAANDWGRWSLDLSVSRFNAQGDARLTFDQEQFGRFTRFNSSETDVELAATYALTSTKSASLSYGRFTMTSEQRGHLDGWPFSDSIFGQAARRYFRSWPEAIVERVSLAWAETQHSGAGLKLYLDYLWFRPQSELWIRETTLVLFDLGQITWYQLNLQEAQILAPGMQKSVALGPAVISYAFAQAIPTKVTRREPAPPGEGGKGRAKGGGYHLLKLTIFW